MNANHKEAKKAIDVQRLHFEELGRSPICGSEQEEETAETTPELTYGDGRRRCDSAQRELLGNHFPQE